MPFFMPSRIVTVGSNAHLLAVLGNGFKQIGLRLLPVRVLSEGRFRLLLTSDELELCGSRAILSLFALSVQKMIP
jgi:hypothetical protein